jgi:hypothetical protein
MKSVRVDGPGELAGSLCQGIFGARQKSKYFVRTGYVFDF